MPFPKEKIEEKDLFCRTFAYGNIDVEKNSGEDGKVTGRNEFVEEKTVYTLVLFQMK